jgi:hypothetical protein
VRNKFLRVTGSYTHYNDSEDIFSIPTDVAFSFQHLLLVHLMMIPK